MPGPETFSIAFLVMHADAQEKLVDQAVQGRRSARCVPLGGTAHSDGLRGGSGGGFAWLAAGPIALGAQGC